jgi:hypothetical protein
VTPSRDVLWRLGDAKSLQKSATNACVMVGRVIRGSDDLLDKLWFKAESLPGFEILAREKVETVDCKAQCCDRTEIVLLPRAFSPPGLC